MKSSLLALASLFVSAIALADGMPPGAVGMPAPNPCRNAEADATAKLAAEKFDAFYKEMSATHQAPVSRDLTSAPVVGSCSTGNLRQNAGVIVRGVFADRRVCGVNYTFRSEEDQKSFARWAYKALGSHQISLNTSLCANTRPRRLGLPVRR